MYDLILYDTSNFQDFPMGGQLTSIRNFLKYIADRRREYAEHILLVGITNLSQDVGQIHRIQVEGVEFNFLPVLVRGTDLANVQKSLRLEYVKALLRNGKLIPCDKKSLHYIHTPEAYIAVKLMHPMARTAVFSHGSFFNMVQGFRFFRKNKVVHFCFEKFLGVLLKTADMLFVLDEETAAQYRKYNKNVYRVENSIVLPGEIPARTKCHEPIQLLFVGRLSRVKGIGGIIEAVANMQGQAHLTIVGDGEERAALEGLVQEKGLEAQVRLVGGRTPDEVQRYYRECDILVMNSVVEGKPMVILEAMSYGMPVVTTPVGGIPEMITEGQTGEFADGTWETIVDKVLRVREDYEVYADEALRNIRKYSYVSANERVWRYLQSRKDG